MVSLFSSPLHFPPYISLLVNRPTLKGKEREQKGYLFIPFLLSKGTHNHFSWAFFFNLKVHRARVFKLLFFSHDRTRSYLGANSCVLLLATEPARAYKSSFMAPLLLSLDLWWLTHKKSKRRRPLMWSCSLAVSVCVCVRAGFMCTRASFFHNIFPSGRRG